MAGKRKDTKGRVLRTGESQRNNGTYQFRFVDKFKKTRYVYAKTLDELRLKEASIERDSFEGIDYCAGEQTVAELVDRYMGLKRIIKPNSVRAYSSAINRIHNDSFGHKRIRNVKKSDAQAWFVKLHDEGLKRNVSVG